MLLGGCPCSKLWKHQESRNFLEPFPIPSGGMVTILFALVSLFSFRFRSRASLELELIALRHQVIVLRRQRPHRLRLLSADRLLWVWFYRVRPQVLETLVLVKPVGGRTSRMAQGDRPDPRSRRISPANPRAAAQGVHGEPLKLGIEAGQAGRRAPPALAAV